MYAAMLSSFKCHMHDLIILACSRQCKDRPTSEYYQPPEDTYYHPEIHVKRCNSSGYCPNHGECLARKRVTKKTVVAEYRS
jgi:hypothetical protein